MTMQWIVEEDKGKVTILPARFLKPEQIKTALSPLAWKILNSLAQEPYYPKKLAKKLKVHEQKIYYHIRNLEKSGLIRVIREEMRQGAMAKIYSITEPALGLNLKPLEPATKLFSIKTKYRDFLDPFIKEGKFNATIVIGSVEPHGPTKERGKDAIFASNLALFFGTFLNYIPSESIKFDTEMREDDLKDNLIIIGGPGVNNVTRKINSKLPIKFVEAKYKNNFFTSFHSDISKKKYAGETYGMIVKTKSPFDKNKQILLIAGRRSHGTKGAVLAFLERFSDLCSGNSYDKKIHARVVDGIDRDGDGIVDYVEFLE